MTTTRTLGGLLLAAALLVACGSVPPEALTSCRQLQILPAAAKTDILFVVDDSPSMAENQANLAANFQAFVDRLVQSPVKNDFQIGITTTSVHRYVAGPPASYPTVFAATTTDCGSSDPPANAGDPYPAGALVRVVPGTDPTDPCKRQQLTTGAPRVLSAGSATLVQDFTNNAFVGITGSGKEQGLEAAKRALTEPLLSGANAGFLRPGSRLAVIVISDDDDCSDPLQQGTAVEAPTCTSYDVQNYVDFFKAPIGGESRSLVLGLIVPVDPTSLAPAACREPSGNAAEHPGTRYVQFASAFQQAVVDSVCNASFHDSLVKIAGLIDPGQTLPLSGTPPDPRLLSVLVNRASGQQVACQVGADVVYSPPTGGGPAQLTFSGSCALQQGDQVDVRVLCAG